MKLALLRRSFTMEEIFEVSVVDDDQSSQHEEDQQNNTQQIPTTSSIQDNQSKLTIKGSNPKAIEMDQQINDPPSQDQSLCDEVVVVEDPAATAAAASQPQKRCSHCGSDDNEKSNKADSSQIESNSQSKDITSEPNPQPQDSASTSSSSNANTLPTSSTDPNVKILPKWRIRDSSNSLSKAMALKRGYDGTLDPWCSKNRKVTLQTREGPVDVKIIPHKALKVAGSRDKYKCPVPDCPQANLEGSRVYISKHFDKIHTDYRSWRDIHLKKDAPMFVVRNDEDDVKQKDYQSNIVSSQTHKKGTVTEFDNLVSNLQTPMSPESLAQTKITPPITSPNTSINLAPSTSSPLESLTNLAQTPPPVLSPNTTVQSDHEAPPTPPQPSLSHQTNKITQPLVNPPLPMTYVPVQQVSAPGFPQSIPQPLMYPQPIPVQIPTANLNHPVPVQPQTILPQEPNSTEATNPQPQKYKIVQLVVPENFHNPIVKISERTQQPEIHLMAAPPPPQGSSTTPATGVASNLPTTAPTASQIRMPHPTIVQPHQSEYIVPTNTVAPAGTIFVPGQVPHHQIPFSNGAQSFVLSPMPMAPMQSYVVQENPNIVAGVPQIVPQSIAAHPIPSHVVGQPIQGATTSTAVYPQPGVITYQMQ